MTKALILLVGAGGHARACIDVIEQEGHFAVAGLVGLPHEVGTRMLGYPVLGSEKGVGEVINIGSNFEISIGDTARTIAEVMGAEIDIITDEQRLRPEMSEVERLWAANDKARELLGWRPQYGGLEGFRRGLSETVNWFSNSSFLASYKSDIYNL